MRCWNSQKNQVDVETFCVWGFKLKILNFYFGQQFFFWILNFSISRMYDLNYIMLQHSNTHFYKLSENVYFYQVIFNRFFYIFSVEVGQNLVFDQK